jgi:hypothetical protein
MEHEEPSYEVTGIVTGRRGAPIGGARVVVWWQHIRERQELIAGSTTEAGHYSLRFSVPERAPQPVLVLVEALSEHLDAPLFSPLTKVQKSLEINLTYEPPDQSEWTVLVRSIEPLIHGLKLSELVEDKSHQDLTFLATETNRSTEVLMRVAIAARLEAAYDIPAAAFYAFLRQQVPSGLPSPLFDAADNFTLIDPLVQNIASAIFGLPASLQTKTLTGAVALDIISANWTKEIPQIVTELQAQRTSDVLKQPYLVGSATLGQLLDVAALPPAQQTTFAQLLGANTLSMRNFWRSLSAGKLGLSSAQADAVQRVLSIGSFVKNYVPLVQTLNDEFAAGTYKSLADLARLKPQDWTTIVGKTGAPPNIDATPGATPEQVFAGVVYARITSAFPTVALAGRIAGSRFIPPEEQKPLSTFFQSNPNLELVKDNLPVYLKAQGRAAFAGISAADQAAVVANARRLQRVLRITAEPDVATSILDIGLSSATEIAALGLQQFSRKAVAVGLSAVEAAQIYQVASQRYASLVSLYMQLNRGAIGVWPGALGTPSSLDDPIQQVTQTDPSLATLFGTQDYCATDDCTSVLSPAAYLCDLLLWLRNHPQLAGSALDVLDARRPDIRHLLLNCPNSDTELPYIDLVIELLADKVSPATSTTLAAAINNAQLSITVANSAGFPAPNFSVVIGAETLLVTAMGGAGNNTWTVTRAQQGTQAAAAGAGAAVIITTAANPPWKQTPGTLSPAQLSAAPAYFNAAAFGILFNASYPQSLPYSAGLDALRTYLQQWNLPLWQLRQALLPVTGATVSQQAFVAGERLKMNVVAQNIVTNVVPVSDTSAWNTVDPATVLVSVPAFLQGASITYESLLELLQVAWVQGGLNLQIIGVGDLCDTSAETLNPSTTLTAAINAAQLSITVASDAGFPPVPFNIGIGAEVLQVIAVGGAGNKTWTVVRAQAGSIAAGAAAGASVVIPLDAGFLDRAHRFLMLWSATGYKMWELDLLLMSPSVGNATLDQNALIALQAFWQLQALTGLSVAQQLAFYQDIDTTVHRDPDGVTTTSLYSQIFLNPTTTWIASDPDLATLPGGGVIGDPVLADHVKAIQPALGISAADLSMLVSLTNNQLSLANLSLIYRISTLASAAKLSTTTLINLATLLSPAAAAPATTLAATITGTQNTLTVAAAISFGPPNFYIEIGTETLLVTGMSGPGNVNWTVARGQLGSSAAAAAAGAAVSSDTLSPLAALAALFASPAATLNFLAQAQVVQQQSGLSLDAITYVLSPPSSITGGWATGSQMTPANIATTLTAVQQAVTGLLAASTVLTVAMAAGDSSITVAGDVGFPAPNFYVYIGTEILLVTAIGGANNTTWIVSRGQQGTTATTAPVGASVTPTADDLNGAVIATVAANAYAFGSAPVSNAVAARILQTLELPPAAGPTLLEILMDPAVLAATGALTVGGSPVAGDQLRVVLNNGVAAAVTVTYVLIAADAGSVNQTATDFAEAINSSAAVTGPLAFLAPCMVSGATITLVPLSPGAAGSSVASTNTAIPGGTGHASLSPATAQTLGQPAFQKQFQALQLFDKVAVLVRGLRLVDSDLEWLIESSANPGVGGLDVTRLPVTAAQPALALTPLLTTFLLIKLARSWLAAPSSAPVQSLYDLIGGVLDGSIADPATAQTALAAITGWPLADIESFAAALGLAFPAGYESPASYDALRKLEAMSLAVNVAGSTASGTMTTLTAPITNAQLTITVASAIGFPAPSFYINVGAEILLVTGFTGADNTTWNVQRSQLGTAALAAAAGATVTPTYGAQIVSWGSVPSGEPAAQSMAATALGILKAQQPSQDAWLTLAPTLMNPLRQNQSAALQAYLVAQRDVAGNLLYRDLNGLFSYFLIDTQMTSCQVTSRVVQAYIAVQTFVERCLMNVEVPQVIVDLTLDDTWTQWQWMSRYRIWEANREVFLYPENWLIESQRPNRTEIFQTFEQEVRQGQSTADYLETVVLNYIDRLDALAHLLVTGTCEDPSTGNIYVVARTIADPAVFYMRSYENSQWGGWTKIPLDIKAHQLVPAMYRGRVCLFWLDLRVQNEPKQNLPAAQGSTAPPSQDVERYVSIGVYFTIFRNGSWSSPQSSKGKLFDKPLLDSTRANDMKAVEAFYTIKVQAPAPTPGFGVNLWIDVFRFGDYNAADVAMAEVLEGQAAEISAQAVQASGKTATALNDLANALTLTAEAFDDIATTPQAVHIGRAVFDGRFGELELNNLNIAIFGNIEQLYVYAMDTYGPDAEPLLPLSAPDPDLKGDSGLLPKAGALVAYPSDGATSPFQLNFTSTSSLEQAVGPLLNAATVPLRIVGPDTDLNFDPSAYFFLQDTRRCYFVEAQKFYWTGSRWSPTVPSDPREASFEVRYVFHPFYHPFTRLIWNQLAGGGFDLLYDVAFQQAPDSVDPFYSDVFNFQSGYQPTPAVSWDHANAATTLAAPINNVQTTITVSNNIWIYGVAFFVTIGSEVLQVTDAYGANRTTWTVVRGQQGTAAAAASSGAAVTPTYASQDRQFLDFSYSGAFSVYNWELFYHVPLFVAQLLSQNQQFEDAQKWFHYIFNPTRQGTDPVPQRFWIPQPLHNLATAQILTQQINNLLLAVNQGDATAVAQIESWRNNPFNPFVLADQRIVAYMKSTVMSYLDNLIAWADNLFSTESREALSEATLIYVIASTLLGPTPTAVIPPPHADASFDQLEPSLDAFANAMVEIENAIGGGSGGGSGSSAMTPLPPAQTFYFKIPPNQTLLNYWNTVADRLNKLRNCENIAGSPLELALFDAPIDPGLLIAAQAAGVDLSSVLSDVGATLPNYRFTALYPQALDFVNAVRAYGTSLQAALEKTDAGALALLQQTTQQQLLSDGDQVLDWQVQQASDAIDAATQTLALAQQKYDFNTSQAPINAGEDTELTIDALFVLNYTIAAAEELASGEVALMPDFMLGAAGFGGTPTTNAIEGGKNLSIAARNAAAAGKSLASALQQTATMAGKIGTYERRSDGWTEAAKEASIQITQANAQLNSANLALQIAQQNQVTHQEQIDNIQKQIDFLNDKFTNDSLYDWMVSSLSTTYFQSYRLAYQMCKQVERCYQFELGVQNSSFIQFGYWDSLHKGLLSGETLNHDLRRLQAAYLQQNSRRFELSRFVSLAALNPAALQQLIVTGACDFTLPESLFDNDYPGHFNRRLTRVSVSVVYPNPGKFDNVKATLTLVANQVRMSNDITSATYPESPVGSDTRFRYNYAAVPQKIALGNAQDDPGLFLTTFSNNLSDQRYLPFENAGAVSSWHLEMPQGTNEVDLTTVGDVVLHLYYTALDGGAPLKAAAQANNQANVPNSGIKVFSAQNDFPVPPTSGANPKPVAPWQGFLYPAAAGANQVLTLQIPASKFPAWTRGKTITVTSLTVLATAWPTATFVLVPLAPLPVAPINMAPVPGTSEPNVLTATIANPGTIPATWSFQIQPQGAANFTSLTADSIGDVLLFLAYKVN